jgi:hypothetical protein
MLVPVEKKVSSGPKTRRCGEKKGKRGEIGGL